MLGYTRWCKVHLYTEQATYSTGHLGCGNPNSSLFFCDGNQGNKAKPLNRGV